MNQSRADKIAFIESKLVKPDFADNSKGLSREEKIKFIEQKVGNNKIGTADTAVMQSIQGATGGFLDEVSGLVEAGGRAAGIKGLGGAFSEIELAEDGPTIDPEELKNAYREGQRRKLGLLKKMESERPALSISANVVGSVVSPINKIAKGMTLAKGGAALGALNAAGHSESEDAFGILRDIAIGTAIGGSVGKAVEKASIVGNKAAKKIAASIQSPQKKANEAEIRAAADRLGIKVTPGMLDGSGYVERLEESLSKSPSYFGQRVRNSQANVIEKARSASQATLGDATNLSQYQLGEKFKAQINQRVSERLDPISAVFDDVRLATKEIPVSEKSLKAIGRNIENLDTYRLTGGAGKPGQYVEMINRIRTADDAKQVMSLLNSDIRASIGAEKSVLLGIKEKLKRLEDNSITRAAISTARENGMSKKQGSKLGSELVKDLGAARKGYRDLSEDLANLSESARIKFRGGPSQFLDDLEAVPSEKISDKFLNPENLRQVQAIATKFPDEFNLLRQGKLREISDSAIDNSTNGQGSFSVQRFLNEARKLNPEARRALFGKNDALIQDIETIQKSLPRNFNPSGTASQLGWQDAAFKNIKDIPTYGLYRAASSNLADDVARGLERSPGIRDIYEKSPQLAQSLFIQSGRPSGVIETSPQRLRMSDETELASNLKGEDKWAIIGLKNLKTHAKKAGISVSITDLEKIDQKKIKNLLIAASDLKPGSRAMDSLVERLRQSLEGGK